MASRNEIGPDPDIRELSKMAERAREIDSADKPGDALHEPAAPDDFTINHLDASDLNDDLTSSFDDEIGLPRF